MKLSGYKILHIQLLGIILAFQGSMSQDLDATTMTNLHHQGIIECNH